MAVIHTGAEKLEKGEWASAAIDDPVTSLTLNDDAPPTVLKVKTELAFVGAPETGKFMWGPSRTYVVLTEVGGGAMRLIFDPLEKKAIQYAAFVNQQSWRSKSTTAEDRFDQPRTGVPQSTANIPTTVFKLVRLDQVFPAKEMNKPATGIAYEGLRATAERILWYGYSSGNPTFVNRDGAIAAAAWLGKTTDPGDVMKPQDGRAYVTLEIGISDAFRDAYLRDVKAVTLNDNNGNGNTALAFSPVPPANICFAERDLKQIDRLDLKGQSLAVLAAASGTALGKVIRAFEDYAKGTKK